MTPLLRKLGLMAHITASVGWLGAVVAFLALSIAGLISHDAGTVRGAYFAMNLIGRFVIVPLSFTALATGIVQALGTEWGLLRHYWVLVKFVLTLFAVIVLTAKIPLMGYTAHRAAIAVVPDADLCTAGVQLAVHAAGGLLVLLLIMALSIFKPWGRTRPASEMTAAGLLPKINLFLAVIGTLVVVFIVFHLISGGLGHHGH